MFVEDRSRKSKPESSESHLNQNNEIATARIFLEFFFIFVVEINDLPHRRG